MRLANAFKLFYTVKELLEVGESAVFCVRTPVAPFGRSQVNIYLADVDFWLSVIFTFGQLLLQDVVDGGQVVLVSLQEPDSGPVMRN